MMELFCFKVILSVLWLKSGYMGEKASSRNNKDIYIFLTYFKKNKVEWRKHPYLELALTSAVPPRKFIREYFLGRYFLSNSTDGHFSFSSSTICQSHVLWSEISLCLCSLRKRNCVKGCLQLVYYWIKKILKGSYPIHQFQGICSSVFVNWSHYENFKHGLNSNMFLL